MKDRVSATGTPKLTANNDTAELGTGNVFADIACRAADQRLLKAKLATKIAKLVEEGGWTQAQTAE